MKDVTIQKSSDIKKCYFYQRASSAKACAEQVGFVCCEVQGGYRNKSQAVLHLMCSISLSTLSDHVLYLGFFGQILLLLFLTFTFRVCSLSGVKIGTITCKKKTQHTFNSETNFCFQFFHNFFIKPHERSFKKSEHESLEINNVTVMILCAGSV